MAELEPISPQTIADSDKTFTPGSLLPSSPPLPLPGDEGSSKPKKKPTVTPRTFTRFFTPRSSLVRGKKIGASRQALQEITASATNRQARRGSNKETIKVLGDTGDEILIVSKKRKARIPASPDTTPDRSSPLKRIRNQSLKTLHDDGSEDTQSGPEDSTHNNDRAVVSDSEEEDFRHSRNLQPINSILNLRKRWPSTTTLARELGILEGTRGYRYVHCGTGVERLPLENRLMQPDWQNETTNFYTRPEGIHVCDNVDEPQEQAIPFCTTSCNSECSSI